MSISGKVNPQDQEQQFKKILKKPQNFNCADCGAIAPSWISLDFGVFVCMNCSGAHRALGQNITKVRSIRLDGLTQEEIDVMDNIGNKIANEYWEHFLKQSYKPNPNSSLDDLKRFTYNKYVKKQWVQPGIADPKTRYSQSVISGVPFSTETSNRLKTDLFNMPPRPKQNQQTQKLYTQQNTDIPKKAFHSDNGSSQQWGFTDEVKFKSTSSAQVNWSQQQQSVDLLSSGKKKTNEQVFGWKDEHINVQQFLSYQGPSSSDMFESFNNSKIELKKEQTWENTSHNPFDQPKQTPQTQNLVNLLSPPSKTQQQSQINQNNSQTFSMKNISQQNPQIITNFNSNPGIQQNQNLNNQFQQFNNQQQQINYSQQNSQNQFTNINQFNQFQYSAPQQKQSNYYQQNSGNSQQFYTNQKQSDNQNKQINSFSEQQVNLPQQQPIKGFNQQTQNITQNAHDQFLNNPFADQKADIMSLYQQQTNQKKQNYDHLRNIQFL